MAQEHKRRASQVLHLEIGRDQGAAGLPSCEEVGCGDEAGQHAGDCCEEAKDILDTREGGVHLARLGARSKAAQLMGAC